MTITSRLAARRERAAAEYVNAQNLAAMLAIGTLASHAAIYARKCRHALRRADFLLDVWTWNGRR